MAAVVGRNMASRRVVLFETLAFTAAVVLLWVDEIIDTPALLFGAEPSPVNWEEALVESCVLIVIAVAIIHGTLRTFARMNHLEGILPICSFCKRIRDDNGEWRQVEAYIQTESDALCSHGICPECIAKHYPDFDPGADKS